MSGKQGYAAQSDPPAGARPARDTGVSAVAVGQIALLTRERDEARAEAVRAVVQRDEARQEREEARRQRDAAQRSQEFAEAEEAVMFRKAAALQRERDEARAAARFYLPRVKFSYDDLNKGKRYERAERQRLPWLGAPETPLEER